MMKVDVRGLWSVVR